MLAHGHGAWTIERLRQTAGVDADLLFAGGAAEMAEYAMDLRDRDTFDPRAAVTARIAAETRIGLRVRALVLARVATAQRDGDMGRRVVATLQMPCAARAYARATLRMADAVWTVTDPSGDGLAFTTRRLTLAAILAPLWLFWQARGDDPQAVAAFLDRRLAAIRAVGRLKARFT
ncbi:hypothetical protein AA103196_3007 [Ameyamaea chiangmaiensis NBRC 103196]|nr:hypothetical protein AA103196_3007 [Ameyamaea chiangmaiensis NBRC 103196]